MIFDDSFNIFTGLFAIGRDIEYQELTLRFRDCTWKLVERKEQEELANAGKETL